MTQIYLRFLPGIINHLIPLTQYFWISKGPAPGSWEALIMAPRPQDIERMSNLEEKNQVIETEVATDPTAVDSQACHNGGSILGKLQRFANKLGVEQRGIERVLPEERTDTGLSKIGTLVGYPIKDP